MLKEEPVWQEFREIGGRGLGGRYEWWPVDQTGNLEFYSVCKKLLESFEQGRTLP